MRVIIIATCLALAGCSPTLSNLAVQIAPTAASVLPGWCKATDAVWKQYDRVSAFVPLQYAVPAKTGRALAKPICDQIRANPQAIVDAANAYAQVEKAYNAINAAVMAGRARQ